MSRNKYLQRAKTWDFSMKFACANTFINAVSKGTPRYPGQMKMFGRWTRDSLLDLGPTFIKFGQLASTRSDIFPPEFISELEILQDNTPPMTKEDTEFMLQNELGDFDMYFTSFDWDPWKSASLGQVHRAVLKDGSDVCVKIQRRGVDDMLREDTANIVGVVDFMERTRIVQGQSAKAILEDVHEYVLQEIDYENEAKNTSRFRRNFSEESWIVTPRVYTPASSKKLLVMEWVPGTKISELPPGRDDRTQVCDALVQSYVKQVVDHGFFHADPHPGNLAITDDGRLVFYDYGLVIPVPKELMERVPDMLACVINMDTATLVDVLIETGIIIPTTDKREEIAEFLEFVIRFINDPKFKDVDVDIMDTLSKEKPFVFPSSLIFLLKSLALIQGVCQNLDPDFQIFKYVEPYVQDTLSDSFDIQDMFMQTVQIPSRIKSINSSVAKLQKQKREVTNQMNSNVKNLQFTIVTATLANVFLFKGDMTLFYISFISFVVLLVRRPL